MASDLTMMLAEASSGEDINAWGALVLIATLAILGFVAWLVFRA